jgi:Protein of unknown function (DUF1822)
MNHESSGADLSDFLLDEEAFQLENIMLSSQQIDQAIQMSEAISHPAEQWQVYLNSLASLGVQQWLQARVPRLTCVVLPNQNLQVGAFQLSVATMGSFTDDWVSVSQAGIENLKTHFYVLVEVLEEAQSVRICGYLRQGELVAQRQSQGRVREEERSHLLPLEWFDLNVDRLLLYLQYLELPVSHPAASANGRLIDVRYWLREKLDDIAQELSWVLLPPLTYVSEIRGGENQQGAIAPVEGFDQVMRRLIEQGMEISSQARGAYREVQLGGHSLRLYVVTWKIARSQPVEWTLLAILGNQSGERLPAQIKLAIRDEMELLDEQVLLSNQAADHLYIQAVGALNERLWVALETAEGERMTLPPFTFSNEEG